MFKNNRVIIFRANVILHKFKFTVESTTAAGHGLCFKYPYAGRLRDQIHNK
jgi:hypothetical protein